MNTPKLEGAVMLAMLKSICDKQELHDDDIKAALKIAFIVKWGKEKNPQRTIFEIRKIGNCF